MLKCTYDIYIFSEKSIQFEEDASDVQSRDTEEIIYRAGNDTDDTNELPPCDTLSEHNINVVRNISTSSLKTEKGIVTLNAFDLASVYVLVRHRYYMNII